MARRSPGSRSGRMTGVLTALLAVVVVAVVVAVVVGVLQARGGDSAGPAQGPTAAAEPVTLEDLVAAAPVLVPRAGFCDRVDQAAVEAVLGSEPTTAETYANGDRVAISPGVEDVAHEHGCTWVGGEPAAPTTARAWVFAPPVTPGRARRLAAAASGAAGCTPYDAVAFGDPGVAWTCSTPAGVTAGHAGLFGDAWLSCTVSSPVTTPVVDLQARADAWCAAVGTGAAAPVGGEE